MRRALKKFYAVWEANSKLCVEALAVSQVEEELWLSN